MIISHQKILQKDPQVYFASVQEFLQKKYENETEIQSEWNRFVKLFSARISLKSKTKVLTKAKQTLGKYDENIRLQQNQLRDLEVEKKDLQNRLKKMSANAFLMFRTQSANIEIPTTNADFFKSDTILIERSEISRLNKRILELGNQKVALLTKNLEEK